MLYCIVLFIIGAIHPENVELKSIRLWAIVITITFVKWTWEYVIEVYKAYTTKYYTATEWKQIEKEEKWNS